MDTVQFKSVVDGFLVTLDLDNEEEVQAYRNDDEYRELVDEDDAESLIELFKRNHIENGYSKIRAEIYAHKEFQELYELV